MKNNYVIFFDFDNTITKFDVLDDMLERFSLDDKWLKFEEDWKKGLIGSRECLDGQMRGIRITPSALDRYLATIKLDPAFKRLLKFCDEKNIRKMILSDNFESILKKILENNGVSGLDVYCNSVKMAGDRFCPEFPRTHDNCFRCAHCKTNSLLENLEGGSTPIYIGDGLSDLCPSKRAGLVFAKTGSTLKERLEAENVPYVLFNDLGDVYKYLKRRIP